MKNTVIPKIILDRNEFDWFILRFANNRYSSVNVLLGNLLLKLGFSSVDTIYLNYVSFHQGKLTLEYSVNSLIKPKDRIINKLTLINGSATLNGISEVVLENEKGKYVSECILGYGLQYGFELKTIEHMKVLPNGNSYVRRILGNVVVIELYNDLYKFTFHTRISRMISKNCGYYLNNELDLANYLCSLEFPFSMFDVFEKVCELSLGDLEKQSDVFMSYNSYDVELGNYFPNDLIHIKCGDMFDFIITRDGKRISTSMYDGWSYRTDKFYISQDQDDGVTYIEDDGLDCEPFDSRLEMALEEVEDVKKLSRVLLNKNSCRKDGN